MPTIDDRFLLRGGLKAALLLLNEVPLRREMIIELDDLWTTGKFAAKIGDGVTHYADLPYLAAGGGIEDIVQGAGIAVNKADPKNPVISSTLGSIALSGYPDDYAGLPSGLGNGDAGKAFLLKSDNLVYVWDGVAFPADGDGVSIWGIQEAPNDGYQYLRSNAAWQRVRATIVQEYIDAVNSLLPVAFWPLDPVVGFSDAVADNDFVPSSSGYSFSSNAMFEGGDGRIAMTALNASCPIANIKLTDRFTIAFWALQDTDSNLVIFEANGNNGFSVQSNPGSGTNSIGINIGGPSVVAITGSLSSSNPSLIVICFDKISLPDSNNKFAIYVNGLLVSSSSSANTPAYGSATSALLGSRAGAYAYNGQIAGLAMFDRALKQTEVARLYSAQ